MSSLFDKLAEIEAAKAAVDGAKTKEESVVAARRLAEITHGGGTFDRIAGELAARIHLGLPVPPPAPASAGR